MEDDDSVGQQVMNNLTQPVRTVYEKVSHFFDPAKNPVVDNDPQNKVDPEDVRKANAGFAARAAQEAKTAEAKPAPLAKRTLGGKARPKKGATVNRQMQRKSE